MKNHVLLIDDNASNLHLFMQAFNEMEAEFKCTYVRTCEHAGRMLGYIVPDAIALHLDPAITDNLEFVRQCKRQRRLHHVPIIVYCETMQYYNFIARGHGADHCMKNPVDTDDIKKAFNMVLLLQPQHRA